MFDWSMWRSGCDVPSVAKGNAPYELFRRENRAAIRPYLISGLAKKLSTTCDMSG
jgi:hypothetical protein